LNNDKTDQIEEEKVEELHPHNNGGEQNE